MLFRSPLPPALLDAIADLRGSLADGYTEYDIASVLGRVTAASGIPLACVWACHDHLGFDGHSQFYVVERDGRLRETAGDLWRWLNDDPAAGPPDPGHPATWAGEPTSLALADLAVTVGCGNFAAHDLTGQATQRHSRARNPRVLRVPRALTAGTPPPEAEP